MPKETLVSPFTFFALLFLLASTTFLSVEAYSHRHASTAGRLILKHHRKLLTQTEHGEISAASVTDGTKGPYHLQFITLEPNSLFLPVLLHADMVFFVHTGSGTLSWTDDDDIRNVDIRKGDIYRLNQGSVFYVQSSLVAEREKLRIYAIFTNTEDDIYEPSTGAYSSIADVVLGFDSRVLQAAFKVPEHVIEELRGASKAPAIIHAVHKEKLFGEWQDRLLKAFLGSNRGGFFRSINGKHKKKAYNVFQADPDFENCNGWSLTVDRKDLHLLKHSNIGVFMVNLTKGSMMAPHWNPRASEIAIVLQGQGMVRVVCSSNANESECRNMRYRVQEGDVIAVPRFHPMAQMSFNNDSFVFMGFSTSTKRNHPQFLAGKRSALGIVDREILALSFNVSETTIDHLLKPQKESMILDCTSCAEEEERLMEEEIERKKRKRKKQGRKKRKRRLAREGKRKKQRRKKRKRKRRLEREGKKKRKKKPRGKRKKQGRKRRKRRLEREGRRKKKLGKKRKRLRKEREGRRKKKLGGKRKRPRKERKKKHEEEEKRRKRPRKEKKKKKLEEEEKRRKKPRKEKKKKKKLKEEEKRRKRLRKEKKKGQKEKEKRKKRRREEKKKQGENKRKLEERKNNGKRKQEKRRKNNGKRKQEKRRKNNGKRKQEKRTKKKKGGNTKKKKRVKAKKKVTQVESKRRPKDKKRKDIGGQSKKKAAARADTEELRRKRGRFNFNAFPDRFSSLSLGVSSE